MKRELTLHETWYLLEHYRFTHDQIAELGDLAFTLLAIDREMP